MNTLVFVLLLIFGIAGALLVAASILALVSLSEDARDAEDEEQIEYLRAWAQSKRAKLHKEIV